MKVYRGSIITCDEKNTVASYLAEDQGRIIYIGDTLPECYGLGSGRCCPPSRTPISILQVSPFFTPAST